MSSREFMKKMQSENSISTAATALFSRESMKKNAK
jgi:hypothetical protein